MLVSPANTKHHVNMKYVDLNLFLNTELMIMIMKVLLQPTFFFMNFISKHLHQTNDFSLFHRNICSLSANLEKLETLISNLEFSFSVIAVSETWTPKGKDEVKPRKSEGYQNYHGSRGSSIKSGCGDYVKKGIKFKP